LVPKGSEAQAEFISCLRVLPAKTARKREWTRRD
jgi:hypothetical protein